MDDSHVRYGGLSTCDSQFLPETVWLVARVTTNNHVAPRPT